MKSQEFYSGFPLSLVRFYRDKEGKGKDGEEFSQKKTLDVLQCEGYFDIKTEFEDLVMLLSSK